MKTGIMSPMDLIRYGIIGSGRMGFGSEVLVYAELGL
jgi:hypothetical protein